MTCIYTTLCKNIMSYIQSIAEYDIITLSYKMYAYCMFFLVKTHFPYTR